MSEIIERVWHTYHLSTVQAEHPLRALCEEARRLEAEVARIGEGGQAAARALAAALGDVNRLADELEQMRALAKANADARDHFKADWFKAMNEHIAHIEKSKEWHRRMQQAEAACAAARDGRARSGGVSIGRALAAAAAARYRDERDEALALLREAYRYIDHVDADATVARIAALLGYDGAGTAVRGHDGPGGVVTDRGMDGARR